MSLSQKQLHEVWDALRGQAGQRQNELRSLRIQSLRGIRDLRVAFRYPVSVLAGPNGCGKSTVLFACACAYRDPARGPREFVPTSLFPNFVGAGSESIRDLPEATEIHFDYVDEGNGYAMVWRRGKSWNRSFLGRKGGRQPERAVYLRTLANLTNPSEVRGALQLARRPFETEKVTEELLVLAHRILPRRYRNLSVIQGNGRDLLFAELDDEQATSYSEFHMSSGERAVLRLSREISGLDEALVLIDEIEAGLHPWTQQMAMLALQRIALRQQLQIVVASHSSVVLDSVPPEGRVFLDRDASTNEVTVKPPYRDIFQKALYGQSTDKLSILCEDQVAEAVISGLLDVLAVEQGLRPGDFTIGRNTGRDEFPSHIATLAKFGKLPDFLVVLDGDSRHMENKVRAVAARFGQPVAPLFLPGNQSPERWLWEVLKQHTGDLATRLGLAPADLRDRVSRIDQLTAGAVQQGDRAKAALESLATDLARSPEDIARIVARAETEAKRSGTTELRAGLLDQIEAWRKRLA